MRTVRLVGGVLVVGLLALAGTALWAGPAAVDATSSPTWAGAAVPAAGSPMLTPTASESATAPALATIPPAPTPRSSDPPVGSSTGQIGSRAISPRASPAAPGQPTFAEADVRAYLAVNGLDLIRVRIAGPYEIASVAFLPYAEARARFGVYVGVPDDRPLCLVVVRGTFTLTGPPVPGQATTVETFREMTLIFDAVSGNRLGEQSRP